MKNLRLALIGASMLLLAAGGTSVVACGNDDSNGFPTATDAGKKDSAPGDDDDDDDDASVTDSGSKDAGTTDAKSTGDASSCSTTPFIPAADETNYCFKANNDAGCSGTNVVCCDLGVKSGSTTTYTASCVAAASDCVAPTGGYADIYACGTPHDCPQGQSCYITAYSGWDGGDFTDHCGKIVGGGASACKTTETVDQLGSGSDLLVCTVDDAGASSCPSGYTCTASSLYSKDFGVCIGPNN